MRRRAAVDRAPVSSSSIASVGYDAVTRILEVEFVHGHVYRYRDVPDPVVRAFLSAPSLGAYLNANIRDAYRCTRA
jgi:hypothetical protein